MTIRQRVSGLEKQLYIAPEIEMIHVQCEQAIMTGSLNLPYGTPGEDPIVNDFGEF
jgi:hypothetical protein